MREKETNPDALLDQAIEDVKGERLDAASVDSAARRVWTRLESEGVESTLEAVAPAPAAGVPMRNCRDLQALIPSYLRGDLSEPRTLLLEDHLRECVPCRRELRALRDGAARKAARRAVARPSVSWKAIAGMAVAAALLLLVGLRQTGALDQFLPAPEGPRATVQSIDGTLFRISPEGTVPMKAGDKISDRQEVRTAKGSTAVLTLRDGSRVEIDERTELYVSENRASKKIQLVRGNIIVEAAPQHDERLMVATQDCLVSVKGTIFSVSHGTKGSRVAVIEGTVVVEHGRTTETLQPGQQASTTRALAAVPLEREVAWSRRATEHTAMARQLSALQKDLEVAFRAGLHGPSQLLDLVPSDTVVYLSIPNLTDSLDEAQRLFEERLRQSPELSQWWETEGAAARPKIEETLSRIRAFGQQLGGEVVVAVAGDGDGRPKAPIFLAEVTDEASFLNVLQAETARINAETGHGLLVIVSDPATAVPAAIDALYLHESGGIFAASPSLDLLREFDQARAAGASGFVGTPLYARLREAYGQGVGYLFSADLGRILQAETTRPDASGDGDRELFRQLGVLDVQNLLVERKPVGDYDQTSAVVSFGDARRGIASWLAEPGPMGALQFVSADAKAAAAFVVKDPSLMAQDLFAILQTADANAWRELVEFQIEKGINIEQDFAAPLGGEVAFALDGPVLPTPSWKVVLEVYNPSKLQHTIEWAVNELNQIAANDGHAGFELLVQPIGGRTFYSLLARDNGVEVNYVFVDGYLIAAPSRALLQNAIQYSQTGYTLASSQAFTELLPRDGRAYFSAIAYQDLGSLLQPLAERIAGAQGGLTPEQKEDLAQLAGDYKPTLVYAYAEPNRITLATTGNSFQGLGLGGAGLGGLLGLPSALREIERANAPENER